MAWAITLAKALEENRAVLFDTCVLIDAVSEGTPPGPIQRRITEIPRDRRFVTDLVLWEFLCGAGYARTGRGELRNWIKRFSIACQAEPPGYRGTLQVMMSETGARGGGVDAQMAAYSISSSGQIVIATNNIRDFCWSTRVPVVVEFVSPVNMTPLDCK